MRVIPAEAGIQGLLSFAVRTNHALAHACASLDGTVPAGVSVVNAGFALAHARASLDGSVPVDVSVVNAGFALAHARSIE